MGKRQEKRGNNDRVEGKITYKRGRGGMYIMFEEYGRKREGKKDTRQC